MAAWFVAWGTVCRTSPSFCCTWFGNRRQDVCQLAVWRGGGGYPYCPRVLFFAMGVFFVCPCVGPGDTESGDKDAVPVAVHRATASSSGGKNSSLLLRAVTSAFLVTFLHCVGEGLLTTSS